MPLVLLGSWILWGYQILRYCPEGWQESPNLDQLGVASSFMGMLKLRELSFLALRLSQGNTSGVKPQAKKKTKTTIVFDADDEAEILRIEDVLLGKGVRVMEAVKIVRLALRVAFSDKTDAEVQAICQELAERWKRGG